VNAALRVHAILADPPAEWAKIEAEPGDAAYVLSNYAAVLALIPAVSGFIGVCVVGVALPGGAIARAPILDGLFGAVFSYVMTCAAVLVLGLLIQLLAPTFDSRRDFNCALKLAVYSYTPLWLAGIFLLAPGVRFLMFTALYGAYLVWSGLPRLLQTPAPKVPAFTAIVVACAGLLTLLIAAAQHALFGLSRF
jgi:Yip1 domain